MFKKRPYLPGQSIDGAIYTHDHFPADKDSQFRVRGSRIKALTQTLRKYSKAKHWEESRMASPSFRLGLSLCVGLGWIVVLLILGGPWMGAMSRLWLKNYLAVHGLQELQPVILLCSVISAMGLFLFSWGLYEKKMKWAKDSQALFEEDKLIRNHELVHVLTDENNLSPVYNPTKLKFLDTPVQCHDGSIQTLRDFAPKYIPINYLNKLSTEWKVADPENRGRILQAKDASGKHNPSWPQVKAASSFWKWTYEGEFRLVWGESYQKDGRWGPTAHIVDMPPAGAFVGSLILGGTGTGKSESAMKNIMAQILGWYSWVDEERGAAEYIRRIGSDPDNIGFRNLQVLEEYMKLSREALDVMLADGKGYAWEKMFMVMFEPKGELFLDVSEILGKVGRSNDLVTLGTDSQQIDMWRTARQKLSQSVRRIYDLYPDNTVWDYLRKCIGEHLSDFWKAEIIRRYQAKDFDSLGNNYKYSGPSVVLQLSDFEQAKDSSTVADNPVGKKVGKGEEVTPLGTLSGLLASLVNDTRDQAAQIFPETGFSSPGNRWMGWVLGDATMLRALQVEGLNLRDNPFGQSAQRALRELVVLLESGVSDIGVFHSGEAFPNGILTGFRTEGAGGLWPRIRPISLLPVTPPSEGSGEGGPPPQDLNTLVVKDLASSPPLDQDEALLKRWIQFCAPGVHLPNEPYREWVFRKRVSKYLAAKRLQDFQVQAEKVFSALGMVIHGGIATQETMAAYTAVRDAVCGDFGQGLDVLAGDLAYEIGKGGLSAWQNLLRKQGYSPIAERAFGEFDSDIRVGLTPIDAAWHPGCWDVLFGLVRDLSLAITGDLTRFLLQGSTDTIVRGDVLTSLRLDGAQALEALDGYLQASFGYFNVVVPSNFGIAVRKVENRDAVIQSGLDRVEDLRAAGVRNTREVERLISRFKDLGHLSSDLVRMIGDSGVRTLARSHGANCYNPLYNPNTEPQSIANEFGAALTAEEKSSGESFWSDAYTDFAGSFIAICMAADGWVTFQDLLQCFFEPAFWRRKLVLAERRLAFYEEMASHLKSGVEVFDPEWCPAGMDLPECVVAERQWALSQAREMAGIPLPSGSWLSDVMDRGDGFSLAASAKNLVVPRVHTLRGSDFTDLLGGGVISERSVPGERTFQSSKELQEFLLEGKYQVPDHPGSPVVETLTGLWAQEFLDRMAGEDRLGIARGLVADYLGGGLRRWVASDWSISSNSVPGLPFWLSPPLTAPPLLEKDIQQLRTTIANFKSFVSGTLQGPALGDFKVRANITVSFKVKVEGLRNDSAKYSFSPFSRFDQSFYTWDDIRTRGLVMCSRITDSVYQGVGKLITRLASQQFQRTVRSRTGRFKTLYSRTADGGAPLLVQANRRVAKVLREAKTRINSPQVLLTGDGGQGPEGKLQRFMAAMELGSFGGALSPAETEGFSVATRRLLVDPTDWVASGPEVQARVERLGVGLLAMFGAIHEARCRGLRDASSLGLANRDLMEGTWSWEDDSIVRGLAFLAVRGGEVKALLGTFRGKFVEPLRVWVAHLLEQQLAGVLLGKRHSDLVRITEGRQRRRDFAVETLQERWEGLAQYSLIAEEPDLRRLGALVIDEVQQFVIGPGAKTEGDAAYLEVARGGMVFNIFATQMPNSLKKALGEDDRRYLGNLRSWLILAIPDYEDAEMVSKLLGNKSKGSPLQVDGTLQSVSSTAGGFRGSVDDLSVKVTESGADKDERLVSAESIQSQEAMQAFFRLQDGQRQMVTKIYTTPYFQMSSSDVNPYGPKGLLLRAEARRRKNPNLILSYKEAMRIVKDHGRPIPEEPVVRLIQHRLLDMSKVRDEAVVEMDPRVHALRLYGQLKREE